MQEWTRARNTPRRQTHEWFGNLSDDGPLSRAERETERLRAENAGWNAKLAQPGRVVDQGKSTRLWHRWPRDENRPSSSPDRATSRLTAAGTPCDGMRCWGVTAPTTVTPADRSSAPSSDLAGSAGPRAGEGPRC